MANSFVNLPVPAGVGVGAAQDVSALGAEKTLIIGGAFQAGLVIEASQDGVNYAQVMSYGSPGVYELLCAAIGMRVRITNLATNGTVPTSVDVGAVDRVLVDSPLDVPVVDGPGVAFDASALGPLQTFIITASGTWQGQIAIEASQDGVNYANYLGTVTDADVRIRQGTVAWLRTVTSGGAGSIPGITIAVVAQDPV